MKVSKTRANEMFQKQFLIVGASVFLIFSVTTIFVLNSKCQEMALKKMENSSERQESGTSLALRIRVNDAPSDTEDDEVTSLQLIEPQPAFVVPDGEDESDFLMQLWAPPPRKGTNIVGIENKGNSCYANSTLQALFRIPEIKKVVFNLEIYLPRLTKDLDELLNLVKENERFLQFKSAFLNLYGRELSIENLLIRFRTFVDTFPAEQFELKQKLQESFFEVEILSLTRKLQLNLRMINKIHLKPNLYPKSRDLMGFLLTDSIDLSKQFIAAQERLKEFKTPDINIRIEERIKMAQKKRTLLAELTRIANPTSDKFRGVYKPSENEKFVDCIAEAFELLVKSYNDVRLSGLAADVVLEMHEIVNEARFYNLYESKKLDTFKIKDRIERMISAYKIVEGLQSIFQALKSNSKGNPVIIGGDGLKLQSFPGKFLGYKQEDAHEYFVILMDAISEVIPSSQSKHIDMTLIYKKELLLPVGFEDEHRPDFREAINHIPLMVSEYLTFEDSLGMFFADNEIPGVSSERSFSDDGASVKGMLIETTRLENIPRVVTFHLKRFDFNRDRAAKINDKFQMPELIDFAPYVEPGSEISTMYRVKTIVFHSGSSNGGHYYSFSRDGNNWYELNDSLAKRANHYQIENAMNYGYIYFYERVEIENLALDE